MGSRDEYLDRRGWRGQDVPTGRAALEAVVSCNATYSIVGGVGHSSAVRAELRTSSRRRSARTTKLGHLADDEGPPRRPRAGHRSANRAADREAERAARLRFFEPPRASAAAPGAEARRRPSPAAATAAAPHAAAPRSRRSGDDSPRPTRPRSPSNGCAIEAAYTDLRRQQERRST